VNIEGQAYLLVCWKQSSCTDFERLLFILLRHISVLCTLELRSMQCIDGEKFLGKDGPPFSSATAASVPTDEVEVGWLCLGV
jgi:hypothetical protein